jgi:hypothetical protein
MAVRLRLANVDQTQTYDFLTGTLFLLDKTWMMNTPGTEGTYQKVPFGAQFKFNNFATIPETLELIGEGTDTALITAATDIERLLEYARLYHSDPLRYYSVWLEANTPNESPRRSLLYGGKLQYRSDVGLSPLIDNEALRATVSMTRHPFWENVAVTTVQPPAATLSCTGGQWLIGGPSGIAPGRIAITSIVGAVGGPVDTIWAGIRPKYRGMTGFISLWELELGTAGTDTAVNVEATASAGSEMLTTFVTTTLVERCSITIAQLGAGTTEHFFGRYLVLLRYRMSAAGTQCGIQMKSGYGWSTTPAENEEIYVATGTAWRLAELGEIQIPPEGETGLMMGPLSSFQIRLFVEQLAAGNIELDALILIPSDHSLSVTRCAGSTVVVTREDDELLPYPLAGDTECAARDWYMPTEDCLLVLAGEQAAAHVLTDIVAPTLYYHPRWPSYRTATGT